MALTREGNALFYLGGGQKNVSVNVCYFFLSTELYLYGLSTLLCMYHASITQFFKSRRNIIDFLCFRDIKPKGNM